MKRFFFRHNELLTLPVSILLWYGSPWFLRLMDPTAGVHDIGLLQTFLIASVGLFFGTALIWLLLKFSAPDSYHILDDYIHHNEKHLTSWQQGLFVLLYYFGLLMVWALLVMAFV